MPGPLMRAAICSTLLLVIAFCFSETTDSFGQRRSPFVCKQTALDALKPMPELIYECGDVPNDWDEKILEFPARGDQESDAATRSFNECCMVDHERSRSQRVRF